MVVGGHKGGLGATKLKRCMQIVRFFEKMKTFLVFCE